ncbi:MAG: hypothetical protein SWQ30_22925, partial [Thermodesulfobacteriota bacterium]|nr:hypothetical protein [Thermodesulfobacteriota bacterium]
MQCIKPRNDINRFLGRVIDSHIISDLKTLVQINDAHRTSYPYLALVFGAIDFFGLLEKGLKKKVGIRFRWFINEWMGKTNPLYAENYLANLIYKSCRNGILHNAVLKNSFNISSYLYSKSKHLHLLTKSNLIFFHTIQFTEDFSLRFRVCVPKVGLNYATWYDELSWGTEGAHRATGVPQQAA